MKIFKFLVVFLFALSLKGIAQDPSPITASDSMTLAQAYINLYLTETYFDTLPVKRISKILPFEENELKKINDTRFIRQNGQLYNFTYSLLYLNKSKLLFRTKGEVKRDDLIGWKNTLGLSIDYLLDSDVLQNRDLFSNVNSFYEMINFELNSIFTLDGEIRGLKYEFSAYFNEDIYPDFKRIYYTAKNSNEYYFDSLTYYTGIYNIPLSLSILNNKSDKNYGWNRELVNEYNLDLKLDLISRYLQFNYLATKKDAKIPDQFDLQILYDSYNDFVDDLINGGFERDEFISKEFNSEAIEHLYNELQKKFPFNNVSHPRGYALGSAGPPSKDLVKYFFPNPAPLASARVTIRDFKPEFTTLGQVDGYLSTELVKAGYKNQLHYYYALDGFALTTSLEKFTINGSPVSADARFSKTLGGEGKFSYYEVFKSLFFEVESEFRMFAFIVASEEVTFSDMGMSASFAQELLINSYETLPEDLKIQTLPNKNLSILVYHFHQNDIGEVPMLDLSGELKVEDHLKSAGLTALIRNR